MTDPRFTDAEIQCGVDALNEYESGGACEHDPDYVQNDEVTADEHSVCVVRAVLRAVGAVPARMLEGAEPGDTFVVGTWIRGQGAGGRIWDGEVLESRPITTDIQTVDGQKRAVWTRAAHSHERPTDAFRPFETS